MATKTKKKPKTKSKPKKAVKAKKAAATKKPAKKAAAPKRQAAATKQQAAPAPAATPRIVPKVSPLKGVTLDQWMIAKKVTGWQANAVHAICAIVRHEVPEALHAIKWAQPVFELNGPFAYIKPGATHVTFGFWRGDEIEDPQKILEGGDRMKHVKIMSVVGVESPAVASFVRQAAQLNREKGDPTKR